MGISYWVFFSTVLHDATHLIGLYVIVGFFVGLTGVVPAVAVKSFPAAVRFTGLSFSYNVAYAIFGGMTPMAVTLLLKSNPLAPTYYIAGLGVLGLVLGLYLSISKSEQPVLATTAAG